MVYIKMAYNFLRKHESILYVVYGLCAIICHTEAHVRAIVYTDTPTETTPLAYSCIIENVTSHSITVRWPRCSGTDFHLTSTPFIFSRNPTTCDCQQLDEFQENLESVKTLNTTDCFATFSNYCPYGDYKITIQSEDKSCSVTQTTLPAVPVWTQTEAVSDSIIRLSWKDSYCTNYGQPIYWISWMGPDGIEITEETTNTDFVLMVLSPNIKYKIALRACDNRNHQNDDKFCSENATVEVSTKPEHPSEPVDLKVVERHISKIKLSWQRPLRPGGAIDGYFVRVHNDKEDRLEMVSPLTHEHSVNGLNDDTAYIFTVYAFNSDTDGIHQIPHSFINGTEVFVTSSTESLERIICRDLLPTCKELSDTCLGVANRCLKKIDEYEKFILEMTARLG